MSKAIQTKANDWAPLLTDIIAISAGLGALALPLSLSVIEATRSRYKSPTLLSIYTQISKTDPQKINRSLFGILTLTLLFKLIFLANIIPLSATIPIIFALIIFSCATASDLYKHLRFTYKLMSDISSVNKLLTNTLLNSLPKIEAEKPSKIEKLKSKFKRKEPYQQLITSALIEIETYEICVNHDKRDISPQLRTIFYEHLRAVSSNESATFIQDVLRALPRMMSEVEISRETDIYQKISGLYLYLLSKAVVASSNFSIHLDEAERISRFREKTLPSYGQFCSNGRIFLDCILSHPDKEAYHHLLTHFKDLLRNALSNNPENIPRILKNANNLLFGTGYDQDQSYALPQRLNILWGYRGNKDIAQDIKRCSNGQITLEQLEQKLSSEHKPKLIDHVNSASEIPQEKIEDIKQIINITIKEILESLTAKQVSESMEIETLRVLGLLLETSPTTIISCRESVNPAGSSSINIGRPLVPSSLNACISALVHEKHYRDDFRLDELLEFKIVDAIGMLIIYELWKIFIFEDAAPTASAYLQQIQIPQCTIRELKDATDRISTLDKSFQKILRDKRISEKLTLLEANTDKLSEICDALCKVMKEKIIAATERQTKDQKLDLEIVDRFKSEMVEDWNSTIEYLPLLKQVKITKCTPYTFTSKFPRYAFLANTGTHFSFNGIGRHALQAYHDYLAYEILELNQLSTTTTLPVPSGSLILLSRKASKDLENHGFRLEARKLVWPNNSSKIAAYIINSDNTLYYQIMKNEYLINISYENSTNGYPITIKIDEKEDAIEVSLDFNFSLSERHKDTLLTE